MKRTKFSMWIFGLAAVVLMGSVLAVAAAEPGTEEDPLVTKSYIDSVAAELRQYVDEQCAAIGNGSAETGETVQSESYTVVRLADGQRISFGEGAELILRQGNGTIFATEKGGIADTTAGTDLADGARMPANHLLIVPVADGRGFMAEGDVLVMVRGTYQII